MVNFVSIRSRFVKINKLSFTGITIMVISVFFIIYLYFPIFFFELKYKISKPDTNVKVLSINDVKDLNKGEKNDISNLDIISPVDENFGIVIPKINANSKVIENVDPFNEKEYQEQLKLGIAHAKGTALPGENENVFLFAHSSASLIDALKYNAVFYLLDKTQVNDEVYLFYKGKDYEYKITGKKYITPNEVEYLTKKTGKEQLTLMTCWPPGSDVKRLIIYAEPVK